MKRLIEFPLPIRHYHVNNQGRAKYWEARSHTSDKVGNTKVVVLDVRHNCIAPIRNSDASCVWNKYLITIYNPFYSKRITDLPYHSNKYYCTIDHKYTLWFTFPYCFTSTDFTNSSCSSVCYSKRTLKYLRLIYFKIYYRAGLVYQLSKERPYSSTISEEFWERE